jgi:hypothetical protein
VPGIAKVYYKIKLIVFGIRRIGITAPAGKMSELSVDKPQPVHAA